MSKILKMQCLRSMCHFFLLLLLLPEVLTNSKFKHPKFTHNVPQKGSLDPVNPLEDLATLIASRRHGPHFRDDRHQKTSPNNDQSLTKSELDSINVPKNAMENTNAGKPTENLTPKSMSMNHAEEFKSPLTPSAIQFEEGKMLNVSSSIRNAASDTMELQQKLEKPEVLSSLPPPQDFPFRNVSDGMLVESDAPPEKILMSMNQTDSKTIEKFEHNASHTRLNITMMRGQINSEKEINQRMAKNHAQSVKETDAEQERARTRFKSSKNLGPKEGEMLHVSRTDSSRKNDGKSEPDKEKFRTSMMEETKPHIVEIDDDYFDELPKYNKTNLMYLMTNDVIIENEYETTEHRLFSRLFTRYNKHIRPTIYGGEVTYVLFKLSLQDIMEMNTRSRMLRINTEMIMLWQDVHLAWDPADYDGVSAIRVPHDQIWVPDIILFNTAEPAYESSILNTNAIIFHDGQIEMLSHALFSSICDVNVEFYPFDEQTCTLRFSSWTYENTEIVISSAKADISHFTPNPEFYLENFYVTVSEEFNECCPLPFSTMTYVVQMQRQSKFALFFFVMPGILINICALLVFSLPVETGEKVGLGVNSMLAMIVFLIAVTENMPPTENLPLAGLYYGVCLSLITSNIAFSVYVLNLNYTGMRGFKVPHFMRVASLLLARALRVPVPREVLLAWHMDKMGNTLSPAKVEPDEFRAEKSQLPDHVQDLFVKKKKNAQDSQLKDEYERRYCRAAEKLAALYEKQDSHRKKNEKKDGIKSEWKFVSRALDRLLVIVFTVTAFFFNVYLLAASPFGYKFMYCPREEGCSGMSEGEVRDLINEIAHSTLTEKNNVAGGGH